MALFFSANTSHSRYGAGLPCALRNAGQKAVYCGANSLPRHAAKSSARVMVFGGILAFLMQIPPACAGSVQIFQDNFTTNNFLTYNPNVGWPPGVGTSGPQYPQMYSRILFNGWPTNSGSQDPSACNQGGSKDAQCYEEYRTSPAPSGVIFNAENVAAPQFPQFSWQSGEMITNPNFLSDTASISGSCLFRQGPALIVPSPSTRRTLQPAGPTKWIRSSSSD
jgi:hypothetical protein